MSLIDSDIGFSLIFLAVMIIASGVLTLLLDGGRDY